MTSETAKRLATVAEKARTTCGELIVEIDEDGNVRKPWLDVVADALDASGVVDPSEHQRLKDCVQAQAELIAELRAKEQT